MRVSPQSSYQVKREFIGRVEPRRTSDVGFELGGKIKTLYANEGDQVRAVDKLAEQDTEILVARLDEASAQVRRLQSDVELAELTLQRLEKAYALKAVSDQRLDDARQSLASLEAEQARAAASFEVIRIQIQKATITAPFDGVVAERFLDEGQVIQAGTPILRLMETGHPEARIPVAGLAIDSIQAGASYPLSINRITVNGTVRSILPVRDLSNRTVDVLFTLEAVESHLRTGDLVRLNIPRTVAIEGVWVPLEALAEGTRGLWAMYTLDELEGSDAVLRKRDVELLHYDGARAFVRGGIDAETLVVTDGLHRIIPGQAVRFIEKKTSETATAEPANAGQAVTLQ
ncbi:MAG: efflux RND transporter periplasmic adaptor subunit [Verrucomicrobiota bacterium]